MAIRKLLPVTPGSRFMSYPAFDEITKSKPEKNLLVPLSKSGGRNAAGRKTSRHRGGGHKRHYRIIDFKRNKDGIPATVAAIEYDPIVHQELHYCITMMEKNVIFSPRKV